MCSRSGQELRPPANEAVEKLWASHLQSLDRSLNVRDGEDVWAEVRDKAGLALESGMAIATLGRGTLNYITAVDEEQITRRSAERRGPADSPVPKRDILTLWDQLQSTGETRDTQPPALRLRTPGPARRWGHLRRRPTVQAKTGRSACRPEAMGCLWT
jgi:hypothetical protein